MNSAIHATLSGRLGADVELTRGGLTGSVHVTTESTPGGEEMRGEWCDFVYAEPDAREWLERLRKGVRIVLTGKLVLRPYTRRRNNMPVSGMRMQATSVAVVSASLTYRKPIPALVERALHQSDPPARPEPAGTGVEIKLPLRRSGWLDPTTVKKPRNP